jgi:hypothetical protein
MPNDKTQVLIELQLEMKKLKSQMKEYMTLLKTSQKQIKEMSKVNEKTHKEYVKSLEGITKAHKKVTQEVTGSEKKKQEALKKTNKSLEEQEKKIKLMAKAWDKIKRTRMGQFGGGFMAGAGLSGLNKQVTARGVGGLAGRGVSGAVGGIANFFVSGMANAYQQFMQYGQAKAGLVGLGSRGQLVAGLRGAGGVGGASLGYGPTETVTQARGVGRATGNIGAVYKAQQFARAYGLDVGEAGGYMGMLRQAGYGFGGQVRGPGGKMRATGKEGSRELTKIIEAGMISGLEKGRIGEFLQGVSSITSQLGTQLPGKINVSGIAAQAAVLGQSKLPGFQGARGMQLLGRLNQAIQAPGGGEAGQAMVLQAMGFGKPGGTTGFYEARKMQQEGLNDPRNLPRIMNEVYSQLGDPAKGGRDKVNQEANLAMSEMFKISLKSAEALKDVQSSNLSSEEKTKKIKEILAESKPIAEQSLAEMKKGFGDTVKVMAGIEAQQIDLGSKAAPYFQAMQQMQVKLLRLMTEWLPKIGKALEKIVHYTKGSFLFASRQMETSMKWLFGDAPKKTHDFLLSQEKRLKEAGAIPRPGEYKKLSEVYGPLKGQMAVRKEAIEERTRRLKYHATNPTERRMHREALRWEKEEYADLQGRVRRRKLVQKALGIDPNVEYTERQFEIVGALSAKHGQTTDKVNKLLTEFRNIQTQRETSKVTVENRSKGVGGTTVIVKESPKATMMGQGKKANEAR